MPRPDDVVSALAPAFAPVLGFRPRGLAGEHLARGVGASLEFEDRRVYAPGDDVRHVDWQVLARTGELMVRVHREEVRPRLDVLVDLSRSMGTEPEKAQAAVDLAALFLVAGEAAGWAARLLPLEPRPEPRSSLRLLSEGLDFEGDLPLADGLLAARPRLAPGGLVVCISDFLTPDGPGLATLATERGSVALVQVLGPWEADPPLGGQARLVDAEGGGHRDLTLDGGLVRAYRERLARLEDQLAREARRHGMRLAQVVAGPGIETLARNSLIPAGLLQPA